MDQAQGEKTEGSRRDQGAVSRGAGGLRAGRGGQTAAAGRQQTPIS